MYGTDYLLKSVPCSSALPVEIGSAHRRTPPRSADESAKEHAIQKWEGGIQRHLSRGVQLPTFRAQGVEKHSSFLRRVPISTIQYFAWLARCAKLENPASNREGCAARQAAQVEQSDPRPSPGAVEPVIQARVGHFATNLRLVISIKRAVLEDNLP